MWENVIYHVAAFMTDPYRRIRHPREGDVAPAGVTQWDDVLAAHH